MSPAIYLRRAVAFLRTGQVAYGYLQFQTFLAERAIAADEEIEGNVRCAFAASDSALAADLIEHGLLPAIDSAAASRAA